VARRARAMLDGGRVLVTGYPDPIRTGTGYPVVVQLTCEAGAAPSVARTLAARPDVRFMALTSGEHDLILELILPSLPRLAHVLHGEFATVPGVARTKSNVVLRTFKTSYDWSRAALEEQGIDPSFGPDVRAAATGAQGPVQVDDVDLQLIGLLGEDGRRTYAELAAAVRMSESVTRSRVSSLIEAGYLTLATLVDPLLLGYEAEAFVWLRVDRSRLESVATTLAAHPEVRYLCATSGTSDLLCEVIVRSLDDLYAFSTDTLGSLEGLRSSVTDNELVTVKRGYVRAAPTFLARRDLEPTERW
jgi:DNA-binding Lrp family transcriptional regulator